MKTFTEFYDDETDEPELNELMTLNNNYFLIIEKNNDIVNNFMNKNKNRFLKMLSYENINIKGLNGRLI